MTHIGQEFGLVAAGGFRLYLGLAEFHNQSAAAPVLRDGNPPQNDDRAQTGHRQRQKVAG